MSILKNRRLREVCQIHSLYQQFRCTDKPYLDFLQYIRYSQPQQYVLDNFQRPLLLFHQSDIPDYDIWHSSRRGRHHLSHRVPRRCQLSKQHSHRSDVPGQNTGFHNPLGEWRPRVFPVPRHACGRHPKPGQMHWHGQRTASNNSEQPE